MILELQAVEAKIGVRAHIIEPDGQPALPYVLIEPVGGADLDRSAADTDTDLDFVFRLKAVGASPTSALIMLRNAKTALTNGRRTGFLDVVGRFVEVVFVRHETAYLDNQATIQATGKVVTLAVDSYRVVSVPA